MKRESNSGDGGVMSKQRTLDAPRSRRISTRREPTNPEEPVTSIVAPGVVLYPVFVDDDEDDILDRRELLLVFVAFGTGTRELVLKVGSVVNDGDNDGDDIAVLKGSDGLLLELELVRNDELNSNVGNNRLQALLLWRPR